jgi:glycosyltransferase involved in cell wall biosynthesis
VSPSGSDDVRRAGGPTVSILTTSYNHVRWLPDTLNSVRSQDYSRLQHVVVDDGSSDGSVELLRSWPDEGLVWTSGPNQGQARALNQAFGMSSGEIIGWLSSDDAYYDRRVVGAVVAAFARHPEAVLVYGHAVLINSDGLQLHTEWVPPTRMLRWRPPPYFIQPAVFVRRSALGDKMVDESYEVAMDTELWRRLARNHVFLRLDRVLAAERHHLGRKSYTLNATASDEGRRLGDWHPGSGWIAHARHKTWRVAYRLAGLTLVPRIVPRPDGFDGRLDSRVALVCRQLAVPRSRLPLGVEERH